MLIYNTKEKLVCLQQNGNVDSVEQHKQRKDLDLSVVSVENQAIIFTNGQKLSRNRQNGNAKIVVQHRQPTD